MRVLTPHAAEVTDVAWRLPRGREEVGEGWHALDRIDNVNRGQGRQRRRHLETMIRLLTARILRSCGRGCFSRAELVHVPPYTGTQPLTASAIGAPSGGPRSGRDRVRC